MKPATPITDVHASVIGTGIREGDEVVDADVSRRLELDREALMKALEKITKMAERVDSWESFPSGPIDDAYSVLTSARANFPTP